MSEMICLDTNYLVRALVPGSEEAQRVVECSRKGIGLCASAIAWYEFLCGPMPENGVVVVRALLSGGVIGFETEQADEAARIFNGVSRNRGLKFDAMIAACAICVDAQLATTNRDDFLPFVPLGLMLV
jgi:predicted nucleic acid-binding protein